MRVVRGLSLYLGLVPQLQLASAGTSSVADDDGIPEVGIGTVHPICDPLVSECISSDEEVQDDIIARLGEDEQVTGGFVWPQSFKLRVVLRIRLV